MLTLNKTKITQTKQWYHHFDDKEIMCSFGNWDGNIHVIYFQQIVGNFGPVIVYAEHQVAFVNLLLLDVAFVPRYGDDALVTLLYDPLQV